MGGSPNPWKVALILEELGVPYKFENVDFTEIKNEPFISINPNGRVPALKDHQKRITLWESGAIIDYLIDTYDINASLHYTSLPEKYHTRCWEHFQMSGQGPYFGQKSWFSRFHPEKVPSAIERYSNEIRRVIQVIDSHLKKQGTNYLVGEKITYADLMFVPYARSIKMTIAPEIDTSAWVAYESWLGRIYARPAVARVLADWDTEIKQQAQRASKEIK
ncbi:hypothetical protein NM208_g740 [Fusarium decemcellulare]|uniref:Uncharacterized protein n=1 Tax=Fusarium decemcellulare TaxID=57161 RepID=A0ACC1SYI4_9HYPO|nr:hypothetical protein NM208_g740 [Fusarium decemcellulare]